MEYVYAAMLLHSAGKDIDEATIKKVLEAAEVKADDGRIKALVASLKDVDIEEAISKAAVSAAPAAAPAAAPEAAGEAKAEEKEEEEDDEKSEEEAASGLASLFG